MKLEIEDKRCTDGLAKLLTACGSELVRCYVVNRELQCIVTKDNGLLHLSISHPQRYPVWNEIKSIRYELLPADKTFAILLPPKEEYVNIHPNCFHVWEVPELAGRKVCP